MLELLDDGNIVNDAEEMEILYLKAKSTANTDEKAETLKKAFEVYQGCLFELGELDMRSRMRIIRSPLLPKRPGTV